MRKTLFVMLALFAMIFTFVSCDDQNYHKHEFKAEWNSDADYHWHSCASCDEISDKAAHTFPEEWNVTEEGKVRECTVCGYKEVVDYMTMSLEEFNNAKSFPDWVKTVVIENVNLTLTLENETVIGNKDIADFYSYKKTAELTEEDKQNVIAEHDKDLSILTTNKKALNIVIKGGTIKGEFFDNPDVAGKNGINLIVSDNSTVIFDGVTFEDTTLYISGQWQQIIADDYNPEVKFPHILKKIVLKNCNFNNSGLFQNGGFARDLFFENCNFTEIVNPQYASNRNPMWFKNIGQENLGWMVDQYTSNVTVNGCTFNTSRPIKLVEETVEGSSITITNNTFNMKANAIDETEENKNKNVAIMFSSTKGELANVLVENNTVSDDAIAFLTFYENPTITMKEGATFIVKGNKYPETVLDSVIWKTKDPIKPEFVQFL